MTDSNTLGLPAAAALDPTDMIDIVQDVGTVPEDRKASMADFLAALAGASWPIGSVFISVVATNPNTLLGFGTWAAFGTGRTIVGYDGGQTEFDTVEETGGEKTHVLITAELASHSHDIVYTSGPGAPNTYPISGTSTKGASAGTGTTNAAGSGTAHNNLQPYIVVYMWKRTA